MITLGIILLIVGIAVKTAHFLLVIGVVLLVSGVILAALGAMGRAVGGRRALLLSSMGTLLASTSQPTPLTR